MSTSAFTHEEIMKLGRKFCRGCYGCELYFMPPENPEYSNIITPCFRKQEWDLMLERKAKRRKAKKAD